MPLNNNERKLLTIVGVGSFVLANVLGFSWLTGAQGRLDRERASLNSRVNSLKMWSGMKAEAEDAEKFIAEHVRSYVDEAQRETHLGELVQGQLVDGTGVEVTKYQRLPATAGEHFDKSRYSATVEGEWEGVMEFIYRLQSPKDFRFVPRITMMPRKNENNDDAQNVQATVELEQWWHRPDNAESVITEPAPAVEQPAPAVVENGAAAPAVPPVPVEPAVPPVPATEAPAETPAPAPAPENPPPPTP
jgi:Type II secretion system (T2SS), protein M subtype b